MIKIMKFGGSSLATPECIKQVANIVMDTAHKNHCIVVVSAFRSITNQLLQTAKLAAFGDDRYLDAYFAIEKFHLELCAALNSSISETIETTLLELKTILHGINLLRDCTLKSLDTIASFGELLSAEIVADVLKQKHLNAKKVDARHFIVTDDDYTKATVLFDATNAAIPLYFKESIEKENVTPVITGFIGATATKDTTTLGRNGSDYTAAIIGAALNVDLIEIWTDVDGVFTANPHVVKKATLIPHLSYEEAMEMSHFGAEVLHPASIAPAIKKQIPILIKNTFNPEAPGTKISNHAVPTSSVNIIKGISAIDHIALFTLGGINMVGVPGTAERLFRALAKQNINIILISQASSEHTICFAINEDNIVKAEKSIFQEFRFEMENALIKLEKKCQQTILAVIGENMIGTPGMAGKFCFALGENKININAIAQGASERNISLAINTSESVLAVNAVHQFFFESHKHLALAVIGVGNVGSAFLSLLKQQMNFLLEKGFEVSICLIANSKKILFDLNGIDLTHWKTRLAVAELEFNIPNLLKCIACREFTHIALIDCTASLEIVNQYPLFIDNNLHIITPNKKANVLPWQAYQSLMNLIKKRQRHFLFEANVGAGLPIISTLQDLLMGGDTIIRIEGLFSGTLSYLFNQYTLDISFSKLVREAHQEGYTEPDPREDLSGLDVGRKLLILGRLLGRKMEFDDIQIESLIPADLQKGPFTDSFFSKYTTLDPMMQAKLNHAEKNHCVLRYVGILDEQGARAELKELPKNHPLAYAKNNDNMITFTTERYFASPLIIQGPGAGAKVTAMGVFSDMLKLLHYLPY